MDSINMHGLAWAAYILGCYGFLGLATALWAWARGFLWVPWLLCGHCIGWAVLLLLPSPKLAAEDSERLKRAQTGLIAGLILAALSLPYHIFSVIQVLVLTQQIPKESGGGLYMS